LNKFFVIISASLIVILAALFVAPAVIDWSRYRGTFEDQAGRLLGRPVRVGEHVRVQLLPSPYVSFDNVRIADASGHFDTPLLRADAFHMQLAIGALLTGSLVAQDIEMTAPNLRLAIGAEGKGNWVGLGGRNAGAVGGELQGLALNSVRIDHGSVELIGAAGWHTRFDDISGELEAPAITGPFRFKGQVANAGKPVDLHFSAGRDDATGKTRLKLLWHDLAAGAANYSLDGSVEGIETTPVLMGTITAQIPRTTSGDVANAVDVKAAIEATPDRAKLSDIEMMFDGGGRPQRVTGSAVLDWRDNTASAADLTAAWLDLDTIAGARSGAGPLATLHKLFASLGAAPAAPDQALLKLHVGEATIGGGTVNDLAVAARNNGYGLDIESLTARLPGLSRLDLNGTLGTEGDGQFSGNVRLWGANLAAIANWALPGAGMPAKDDASAYLLDGSITADATHFRAQRLRTEISGTTVTGSIAYASSEPRSLSVSLDSGRLDVAKFLDGPLAGAALSALLTPQAVGDKQQQPADGFGSLRTILSGDSHLDLRIGHLIMAQGALRDVSARLDRSNGRLDIPAIELSTAAGFALHIEGALQQKGDGGEGQLRLTLAAPDPKALGEVAKLLGLAIMPAGSEAALAAFTPLRLAGTMQLGGSASANERLQVDGLAKDSRISVKAERDGGDTDWLGTRLDMVAELSNPDEARLMSQIAQAVGTAVALPPATSAGKLTLHLSGVPKAAMFTSLAMAGQTLRASFDGRASINDQAGADLDGSLGLDAANGSTALTLARLDKWLPAIDGPLKLTARIKRDAGQVALTDARGLLGGEAISGEARLDSLSVPPKLEASVVATTLRLDKVLAMLAPGPPSAAGAVWSERPINFTPIAGLNVTLDATAAKLVLVDGIAVNDAKLDLTGTPAGLDLVLRQGRLGGGDITGRAQLAKQVAGAELQLDGALSGAGLDGLSSATTGLPRPHGRLGLSAHLVGQGLTPRDLAASATGTGEFSISEGSIAGMSPLGLDAVARDVLADAVLAVNEANIAVRLDKARQLAPFPMLGAHGAITIADGTARFDRLKVQSSKADLEISNRIELASLRLASTWTLQPRSPQPGAPTLAAVPFVFEAPLTAFAAVTPAIDASAFARDLTSRKLLGGPEQMLGIWPTAPPPLTAPAESTAPLAENTLPAPPVPAVTAPATIDTASLPAAVAPGDLAAPAATPDTASVKRTQTIRPHKKKTNWAAALLQDLFGN